MAAFEGTGRGQSLLNALSASLNSKDSFRSSSVTADSVLCICNRPLQDILCRACGYVFTGRARKQCPYHRNAILLMDSPCCPKCKVTSLLEFGDSNTPTKRTVLEEKPVTQGDDVVMEKMQDGSASVGEKTADLNPVQKKVVEAWEEGNVITVVKNKSPIKSRVSKDIRFSDVRH